MVHAGGKLSDQTTYSRRSFAGCRAPLRTQDTGISRVDFFVAFFLLLFVRVPPSSLFFPPSRRIGSRRPSPSPCAVWCGWRGVGCGVPWAAVGLWLAIGAFVFLWVCLAALPPVLWLGMCACAVPVWAGVCCVFTRADGWPWLSLFG